MNDTSANELVDLPLWKAREPENEDAALQVLRAFWLDPHYRDGVREAFEKAQSPRPHLYLSCVPDTGPPPVWISYILDDATHSIILAHFDGGRRA